MWRSFLLSSCASFLTGIPVIPATTSATSSAVTFAFCSCFALTSSFRAFSSFSLMARSRSLNSAARSNSCDSLAVRFSHETPSSFCSSSRISSGMALISRRARAPASSITSIALSGRKRSEMYRSANFAAATMASSVISALWCSSYRHLSPLRISIVCSTVGASTMIGWNLRSNAPSFSMCLRYSSSVVAPMH